MTHIEQLIKDLCPNGVEFKTLGEVCDIVTKQTGFDYTNTIKPALLTKKSDGAIPYLQTRNFSGRNFEYETEYYVPEHIAKQFPKIVLDKKCLLISIVGSIGNVGLFPGDEKCFLGGAICMLKFKQGINISFVYEYMSSIYGQKLLKSKIKGSGQATITIEDIRNFSIPFPPQEIQERIVAVLEEFSALAAELQAELQARRKQYEYYRTHLLTPTSKSNSADNNDGCNWTFKTLGEIGKVCMCKRILKEQTNSTSGIPFYKIGTFGGKADAYIDEDTYLEYKNKYSYPKKGDILISAAGTIGKGVVFDGEPSYFQDSNIVWIANDESLVLNKYLYYYHQIINWKVDDGGVIKRLYNNNLKSAQIAFPSLEKQARIVSILDAFDALTTSLSEGIPAEQAAQQKRYEYYRDLLLTFDRKAV